MKQKPTSIIALIPPAMSCVVFKLHIIFLDSPIDADPNPRINMRTPVCTQKRRRTGATYRNVAGLGPTGFFYALATLQKSTNLNPYIYVLAEPPIYQLMIYSGTNVYQIEKTNTEIINKLTQTDLSHIIQTIRETKSEVKQLVLIPETAWKTITPNNGFLKNFATHEEIKNQGNLTIGTFEIPPGEPASEK